MRKRKNPFLVKLGSVWVTIFDLAEILGAIALVIFLALSAIKPVWAGRLVTLGTDLLLETGLFVTALTVVFGGLYALLVHLVIWAPLEFLNRGLFNSKFTYHWVPTLIFGIFIAADSMTGDGYDLLRSVLKYTGLSTHWIP